MYADDICLMAPSPAALQELINICYDFSARNDLSFNASKSYCSVYEKLQATRAKVAPVNLIYGSHFTATEAI